MVKWWIFCNCFTNIRIILLIKVAPAFLSFLKTTSSAIQRIANMFEVFFEAERTRMAIMQAGRFCEKLLSRLVGIPFQVIVQCKSFMTTKK